MSGDNADSLLKSIYSTRIKNEIDDSYDGVAGALKHAGAPSNNMLLSNILSEGKRTADEVMRLNMKTEKLEQGMDNLVDSMSAICKLLEKQNEILASISIGQGSSLSSPISRNTPTSQSWYYQGNKLSSRYHVYACILFHFIDMVQVHMDLKSIYYPDSVDCDFKSMQNAVRIVCTERCSIPTVEYKNTIIVKDKDSQPFDILYPIISSTDPAEPTSVTESLLSRMINPVTRNVMQEIEWIRQRLCHLQGIVSVKQIDILKSIKAPFLKQDSNHELNWDERQIRPRSSHPLVKDILELSGPQRSEYIKLRMKNKTIEVAYEAAKEFTQSKK